MNRISPRYISYPENIKGTDYVCTDIHNCFDQLQHQLLVWGFNPHTDRLFVCGDMIDRGDYGDMLLGYLKHDWFIPILGNHELFMLAATFKNEELPIHNESVLNTFKRDNTNFWFDNGGEWWDTIPSSQQEQIYQYIKDLPLAIDVTVSGKKVGMVHAEMRGTWSTLQEKIKLLPAHPATWLCDSSLKYTDPFDISDYVESRQKIKRLLYDPTHQHIDIPDIDMVIHGHTWVPQVVTLGNCVYIDHGSYGKAGQRPEDIEFDPYGLRIHRIQDLL